MKKNFFIFPLACMLAACATPIPASEMMPNPNMYNELDENKLTRNVEVGEVTLSDDMPTVGFVATKEEFSKVLHDALNKAHWLNKNDKPRYRLDARLMEYDQPLTLFNTKIFSIIEYDLVDLKNDTNIYHQNVKIPCVKGMGEIFDGNQRQIETMKCAIRENVTHVFRDLNAQF